MALGGRAGAETLAVLAPLKPHAVCEAFRRRCGGFSRSRAPPTTPSLSHFRTLALSHARTAVHSTSTRSTPSNSRIQSAPYAFDGV
jgi:hypothetical protein